MTESIMPSTVTITIYRYTNQIRINMSGKEMNLEAGSVYLSKLCQEANENTCISITSVGENNRRLILHIVLDAIINGYNLNENENVIFTVKVEDDYFAYLEDSMNNTLLKKRHQKLARTTVSEDNEVSKSELDTTSLVDNIKQAINRYDEYALRRMAGGKYRTRKAKECQEGAIYDLAAVILGESEIIGYLTGLGVTLEEIHEFRFQEGFVNVEKLYRKILQSKNFI